MERRSERPRARLRRARREDIPALVAVTGGPSVARPRAIRRILKTLAADVYVLDRERRVDGVVAVFYRRSLRHGGLVATIDAAATLSGGGDADLATLLDGAIARAERRGCVAIDAAADDERIRNALAARGFREQEAHLLRALDPAPHRSGEEGGE